MNVGAIMEAGFRLFRRTRWSDFALSLAMVLALQMPTLDRLMRGVTDTRLPPLADLRFWLLLGFGSLLFCGLWAALTLRQAAMQSPGELTVGAALARAAALTPRFWLLWMLCYAAIGVGALLVLPGIYLLVACAFVPPTFLFNEPRIIAAFAAGVRRARGRWWRSLGVLALSISIFLVFFVVAEVIAAMMAQALGADEAGIRRATYLMSLLATAAFMPMLTAMVLTLFRAP